MFDEEEKEKEETELGDTALEDVLGESFAPEDEEDDPLMATDEHPEEESKEWN